MLAAADASMRGRGARPAAVARAGQAAERAERPVRGGRLLGLAAGTAATVLEPEVVVDDGEIHAELHYKPLGVVGAIGPWNWPLMIAIWQIAPSLRMGNTVIVKPSSTRR